MTVSEPNAVNGARLHNTDTGVRAGYGETTDGASYWSTLTKGRRVYVGSLADARAAAERDAR